MANLASVRGLIEQKTAFARGEAQKGLTISSASQLLTDFTQMLVREARKFINEGYEKKEIVLAEVGKLFDQLAPSIQLPWFLAPFRSFVISTLRAWVMQAADGAIEAIYAQLKELEK